MTTPPYAAVVFDLDGTLIDTESYYRPAFHAAAADFGVSLPPDLYPALVGLASHERVPLLRRAFGADFPVQAFMGAYYVRRAASLPARIPLCAGADALLRCLRLPKAVATSASRRTALDHLARAGLGDAFAHVVTRDDVPRGKPAPDTFLAASGRLGIPPSRCLAVEDSATGVAAACRAGMDVVLVARGADAWLHRSCRAVVPTLHALISLLGPRAMLPEPCSVLPRSDRDGAGRELMTHTP